MQPRGLNQKKTSITPRLHAGVGECASSSCAGNHCTGYRITFWTNQFSFVSLCVCDQRSEEDARQTKAQMCVCVCACVSEGALARGYACGVDVFLLGLLPGIVRGSRCGRIRGVVASLRVPGVCACAAFVFKFRASWRRFCSCLVWQDGDQGGQV